MRVLVLDTIHGGNEIGAACRAAGNTVDVVDIYTGTTPALLQAAATTSYDLIVAPVHLDPDHPLLSRRQVPVITHHEAVRHLLGKDLPSPLIEITGARGKTTTAHALAHLLPGKGVLHTSTGTYGYPEKTLLGKRSITPASVIPAARSARGMHGWLVAEISLGVTGAGDLAIITSPEDYLFAAGKKHALDEKIASLVHADPVLVAPGVPARGDHIVHLEDMASVDGTRCAVAWGGERAEIENPLFGLPPYRVPLMLAAAAAMILDISPRPLTSFEALPGRMAVSRERNSIIVDNANSGTNAASTVCAAHYARSCSGTSVLTLVIGQVVGDGAVCEGFSHPEIARAIGEVQPAHLVWVGRRPDPGSAEEIALKGRIDAVCTTLNEARETALRITEHGSIVLSVKTWR